MDDVVQHPWRVWLRDSKWQSLLQFDGTAGSGSEDALEEVLTSLMQWAVRVVGASEKSIGGTEVSPKIALEPQSARHKMIFKYETYMNTKPKEQASVLGFFWDF